MTEELQDKELTDIKYLRARMTGNVGLALDHAYNLGFFDGEKNVAKKIRAEIKDFIGCPYDKCKGNDCIFCLQDECTVRGYRLMEILDKYITESENKE